MQAEHVEIVYSAALETAMVKAQQRQPLVKPLVIVKERSAAVRGLLSQYRGQWWSIDAMSQTLRMDRRLVTSRVNGLVYEGVVERRHPPLLARGKTRTGVIVHRGQIQGYRWIGQ